jgi:hypothetical protein
MVQARKDAVEERKLSREKDADVERRRVVAEERRATANERRLALEEKRDATEENHRLIEQEKNFFLMDTSNLDDMGGNVGMGAMGAPPGGFMSMVSPMPSMPTPNDGFIPSPPIHSTNAHTTKVQIKMKNKMEVQKKMVMMNDHRYLLLHAFVEIYSPVMVMKNKMKNKIAGGREKGMARDDMAMGMGGIYSPVVEILNQENFRPCRP